MQGMGPRVHICIPFPILFSFSVVMVTLPAGMPVLPPTARHGPLPLTLINRGWVHSASRGEGRQGLTVPTF